MTSSPIFKLFFFKESCQNRGQVLNHIMYASWNYKANINRSWYCGLLFYFKIWAEASSLNSKQAWLGSQFLMSKRMSDLEDRSKDDPT